MERKSFPFELEEKGLDPEARTFKGYAAVTGILDDGGDIIDRGAFKKTLKESGHRVKVFYIHDFYEPIGKPVIYDDGKIGLEEVARNRLPKALREKWPEATGGLFVHCKISETTRGNDAMTLMRDKVLDELSIGYKPIKEDMKEDGPDDQVVRHLKELGLMDVSPVPLGMNPAAIVTDVKEAKVEESEDFIRIPVAGESGKHDGHRIRTITISKEKGITALYCGECKTVITYLFAKEKDWTIAMAKEWVKEHEKSVPWDALDKAIERQDKELDDIIEGQQPDEDRGKQVINALIQQAEIQRQRIEALR